MQTLCVYSRQGCHLCELLVEELLPIIRGQLQIEVRDIDSRPDWLERFNIRIPVVEFEGKVISEYPLDRQAVISLLEKLP